MLSQHPLEVPEILSHIALYVHERSLPACARVSKGWYQAFIPQIWKDINLTPQRLEAMPRYSHHVKKLRVGVGDLTPDLPQCPNLQSLVLYKYPRSTELVLNHLHITRLCVQHIPLVPELWTILPQLHSLRELDLQMTSVPEQETDTFWQFCTRLERLNVHDVSIPHQGQLSSMAFPNLKQLTVWYPKDLSTILEFMSRCPNLAVLRWCDSPYRQDSNNLVEMIAAKTWPHLHSIGLEHQGIPEEDLIRIMNSLQRMTCLQAKCLSVIQPGTMDLVRPHFASLTTLNLGLYADPSTNRIAQEILSSCPLLERLLFDKVDATAVAEGKPWVCTRLKLLSLHFQFDPLTISDIQPRVFEQIARLYRLDYLRLRDVFGTLPPFQTTVDLRLENGLDKLSTLRSLRVIDFDNSIQKMGEKEIEWVLEHWTSLDMIIGRCNRADSVIQDKLMKLLREHGVKV
ncbi:MAG: hypothetical protein J3Q66DRAFT_64061 [Benniella sp.]|nr:MAG: hypothetical protein J3Q66DRAFT_64061 [Benniella sp.]